MADRARYERDGDLGVVVIHDPPLNLFGRELAHELLEAFDQAERDGVRALLIRADGDVFTAGVDVHVFAEIEDSSQGHEFVAELLRLTHRLEELPFPVLTSVHGLCLTAGFELSLACDMIWAGESARFGLVERVVGLTPLMGGTQRVAERAGPARACQLVMTGDLYDAAELERWHVVNRVLPDAELAEKSLRFAHRLAEGPTVAHASTKRIVRAYLDSGVRGADAETPAIGAPLFDTEDLKGAVKSFLEEGPGKATFKGR